jgi:hypothetical protein
MRFVGRSQEREGEEDEENKGRNLMALKRRKRETETELYSLDDALGFYLFFNLSNKCPVCPGLPLLTYDGNERRITCFFFF